MKLFGSSNFVNTSSNDWTEPDIELHITTWETFLGI